MNKVQQKGKIVSNKKITSRFYNLSIDCKLILKDVKPGQFIHLKVNESVEPFFRRPFSVFRADKHVEIFYEVVGKGTNILSQKKPGENIGLLGPLGNAFTLPSKDIKNIIMIAGGIGIAPFMMMTDVLKKRKDLSMTLLYGGRTKEHTFSMKPFKDNGCKVHVSTDDGSVGVKGRVSELYKKIELDPKTTFIYTCGPKPMMRSVQEFAGKHGIIGEASCEEVMACGVGICLGCAIKIASGIKTVCKDGPVFDLQEVKF